MSTVRYRRGPAAVFAALLCAGVALAGAHAAAAAPDPAPAKVDDAVLKATAGPGQTTFFVRLKDQGSLDTGQLDRAERAASSKGTRAGRIARTGEVRRQKVEHADETQQGLRTLLTGRHVSFTPFWISNVIEVTGGRDLVDTLAARGDVAAIQPVHSTPLDTPVPTKAAPAAAKTAPAAAKTAPAAGKTGSAAVAGAVAPTGLPGDLAELGVDKVWSAYGDRGEGIVVGSVDTGVQFDHPALVRQYRGTNADGTVSNDYNWFDPTGICGASPCDNYGHGTHTVGTMVGDDGAGATFGVAPGAKWIAAKGCEYNSCSDASLLAAGQWIVAPTDSNGENPRPDLSPDIVNNSWGGSEDGDLFFDDVISTWVAAGIFPVFANGNDGEQGCGTAGYPGSNPQAYAVGATDDSGAIASFSSRGTADDGSIRPNIAAPGVDIVSSLPGSQYGAESGTSMAAPHVAGTIALLWSAVPNLRRDIASTRALLDSTARDVDDESCGGTAADNNVYGQGLLDAYALIQKASATQLGGVTARVTTFGRPLAGAAVRLISATVDRSGHTDAAGRVQLGRVPAGDYKLQASSFGLRTVTSTVTVGATGETTASLSLNQLAPLHPFTGTITGPTGEPVSGAKVTVAEDPFHPFTTGKNGKYSGILPEGDYSPTVDYGRWLAPKTVLLTVGGRGSFDVQLAAKSDTHGYVAGVESTQSWNGSGAALALTGDEASTAVTLPFPMSFYGRNYRSATVSSNGYLAFGAPNTAAGGDNVPLPAFKVAAPAVYAFWDDLILDKSSRVTTRTSGTAPARQYTVTWLNAKIKATPQVRVDFQLTLQEGGTVVLRYHSPIPLGAGATAGIQGPPTYTGSAGGSITYSSNAAVLSSGTAVTFHVAGSGLLRGTVTDANDHQPIAGAMVQLPGEKPISTATDADGFYQVELPAESVSSVFSAAAYQNETGSAVVHEATAAVLDVSLKTGLLTAGSPAAITLAAGASATVQVPLANKGSAPATWDAKEINSATPPAGVPGRILSSFLVPDLAAASGIGLRNGELTVSDAYYWNLMEKFGLDGTPLGTSQVAMNGFTSALTYLAKEDLFCGPSLSISGDLPIVCFDPTTNEVKKTITVPGNKLYYGLTYRASDDTFYLSGDQKILHIAGPGHDNPGEVLSSCTAETPWIEGLALNEKTNVLWGMAQNDRTGVETIIALDPATCATQGSIPDPDPRPNSEGGLALGDDGTLRVVGQDVEYYPAFNSDIYHVEGGTTGYSDVPWLSVGTATGELAAGETAQLGVTVDTSGLAPGTYTGTVLLVSNGAKAPGVPVTVSVTVS